MRHYLLTFVFSAAMTMGGAQAYAQTSDGTSSGTSTSSTQQTDQSEEAWRKSKKKSTSKDPFDPFKNILNSGQGMNLPPMRPIDKLPEESRKHLMKQRARVIATMEFGDSPQAQEKNAKTAEFKPSEAAKNDPALAKEEEAVWDVIVTDLKGGNSGSSQSSQGGPNKVAVVGRGGNQSGSVMRGGSAQSASEIMAMLKGLKSGNRGSGNSSNSGNGMSPTGTQDGGNGQNPNGQYSGGQGAQGQSSQGQSAQDYIGQGQTGQSQTGQSQTDQGQNQSGQIQNNPGQQGQAQNSGDQSQNNAQNNTPQMDSVIRGGSAQSASEIMFGIKNTQSQGQNTQVQQQGQQDGMSEQAQEQGQQQGQQTQGQQQDSTDAQTASSTPYTPANHSLLNTPETQSDDECSASSAAAYLRQMNGDVSSCD